MACNLLINHVSLHFNSLRTNTLMLKKAGLLSLIGFAFAAPNTAMANNFSYNFLEVRTAISPESFGGEFSTNFTDNSHFDPHP